MRAVVQRVTSAGVTVEGRRVGTVGAGVLVLLGVATGDTVDDAVRLAAKIARLRIFAADDGRFDRSLLDTSGEALVVSQFTLLADSKRQKGTRPDFSKAARPEIAEPLYERFCEALRELGVTVQTGVFGAKMAVTLVNDGPVTIILDVDRRHKGAPMTPDPNQLREFAEHYTAAWCSGNPARVAESYAPDGSLTINEGTPSVGRAAITDAAKAFMDAFPDMQVLMDDVRVGEGGSEYHWTLVCTNTGPGGTGNRVRIGGYEEWMMGDDGLIAASQGHYDQEEYDRQVEHGVDEPC